MFELVCLIVVIVDAIVIFLCYRKKVVNFERLITLLKLVLLALKCVVFVKTAL